ncbi:(2Fe-2S)-binding protein [Chondromyces crocatus]|uniref:(2Fe-2S)-binding protein n=1 Tax=Chondromyces crocatus TaxID=52 RepID=UPI0009EBCFA0|nr:(2Fe-2S)-binding protein [Chondromyces crocatus]
MYVCLCNAVTDHEIKDAIGGGASTMAEVMRCTKAGTCCGSCQPTIAFLLDTTFLVKPKTRLVAPEELENSSAA